MNGSRRCVLASIGTALTAGCTDRFAADSGIKLGSLRVANPADRAHTVDLWLERDGQGVYDGSVEVAPDEDVWIDPTWSSEPAEYDLYYTVSDSDEVSVSRLHEIDTDINGECSVGDLWTIKGSNRSGVSLRSVDQYEAAECNV
ncbi:hypothetical protein [Natrialba asiatica]|uniref:Uncharacterized protein n=1 Tax=Natrialba asiatica (strain ATCC 700177 / DSM 12278 / JCM 9576 / FERM P-10747 / NBRC 102637 / 172P1) TaxID=29540 RepID=M0AKG6_NATA1|nr:hypothetical protein [Natrialba asiatica]ELY97883.1 hypothetical protein C481_18145 [Natrialba asiatica DSM 12278]